MADGHGYPLVLDLRGRRVLVAGGGRIASRRTAGLLAAGADVLVVAPELDPDLAGLAAAGRLQVARREVAETDVEGAWLVQACTDDPAVNAALASAAQARQVPCVRADDAAQGSARTPAVHRGAGLTVAVSSDTDAGHGADSPDPRRVRAVRDAVGALVDSGALPLRAERPRTGTRTGRVALVGGGPGDPGLITVRGRLLLSTADVVVTDRLGPTDLLADLSEDVEVLAVGKRPRGASTPQAEINALLVDRALAGAHVVRLKGGDPFVFGRGAEEAQACVAAGVPF